VLRVRSIEPSSQPAGVALPARGALPPQWARPTDEEPVRIMPAPEFDEFTPESRAALLESDWKVSPQSNRMGFRLEGPALTRVAQHELKSHAVFPGVIQVPKGGAPIVLMADAHTTGGYPRIATVIAVDQWRLAQIPPGGSLRFSLCTRLEALQALKRSLDAH
jgi:5-oxoprolinase (ATP-hydrolysing) subunit C